MHCNGPQAKEALRSLNKIVMVHQRLVSRSGSMGSRFLHLACYGEVAIVHATTISSLLIVLWSDDFIASQVKPHGRGGSATLSGCGCDVHCEVTFVTVVLLVSMLTEEGRSVFA